MRQSGLQNLIIIIDLIGKALSQLTKRELQFNLILKSIRDVYSKM